VYFSFLLLRHFPLRFVLSCVETMKPGNTDVLNRSIRYAPGVIILGWCRPSLLLRSAPLVRQTGRVQRPSRFGAVHRYGQDVVAGRSIYLYTTAPFSLDVRLQQVQLRVELGVNVCAVGTMRKVLLVFRWC